MSKPTPRIPLRAPARAAVLPLIAAIALLAGCGGHASENDKVTSVVRRYFAAVGNGNGSVACSLLSDAAKSRLRSGASCPQLVSEAHRVLSPEGRKAFVHVGLSSLSVAGNTATVQARTATRTQKVTLTKSSGAWRIDTVGS